jgi:hypothetical protein
MCRPSFSEGPTANRAFCFSGHKSTMYSMREKFLWAAVVIFGVVLTASRAQSPSPRQPSGPVPGDVGRYQLNVGPSASNIVEGNYLYRVDTHAGKTWWYSQIAGTGQAAWVEVPEFASLKPPQ